MSKLLKKDPTSYLATSEGRWCVIYQGLPICADTDRATAEKCAVQFKIKLPAVLWNGDLGQWLMSAEMP